MKIDLNQPYKIIAFKQKKYGAHYQIPASTALIVPIKSLGDEVLCDVRWLADDGAVKVLHEKMFVNESLVPLNEIVDEKLFDLWTSLSNEDNLAGE